MEDLTWLSKGCRWRTEKRFPIEKFAALPWSASCRPFKTLLSSSAPVPTLHLPRHFAGETVRDPTVEMAFIKMKDRHQGSDGAQEQSTGHNHSSPVEAPTLDAAAHPICLPSGKLSNGRPNNLLYLFSNALSSMLSSNINGKARGFLTVS